MKTTVGLCAALALILLGAVLPRMFAAESPSRATYEYVTIRWAGKENTHIIRPGGNVEFIGGQLRQARKPDKADDRSFYLNVAMNGLTKEGYEFAGISADDIVMKRPLTP